MKLEKIPTVILFALSILACAAFYGFFVLIGLIIPTVTDSKFENEWIYVVVASIPLLIILAFLLAGNISKAKVAGLEFDFSTTITPNLIDKIELNPDLNVVYKKGSLKELEGHILKIRHQADEKSKILVVALDANGKRVAFSALRQYVHQLSEYGFVKFVVFVDEGNNYLGFTTVEYFKKLFPKLGIELLANALGSIEIHENRMQKTFLPILPDNAVVVMNDMVDSQWDPKLRDRVSSLNLKMLGAGEEFVDEKTPIDRVYWEIVRHKLIGIPVVTSEKKFLGIATKESISDSLIMQMLDKSVKSEKKA